MNIFFYKRCELIRVLISHFKTLIYKSLSTSNLPHRRLDHPLPGGPQNFTGESLAEKFTWIEKLKLFLTSINNFSLTKYFQNIFADRFTVKYFYRGSCCNLILLIINPLGLTKTLGE